MKFDRSDFESLWRDLDRDLTGSARGSEILIVGEVSMLQRVKKQFNEKFLVKIANIFSWFDGYERQGPFLKRTISTNNF